MNDFDFEPIGDKGVDRIAYRRKMLEENLWEYDEKVRVLRYKGVVYMDGYFYEVDPERALTRDDCLDWIVHISNKTWATDEVVGALANALKHLLGESFMRGGEPDPLWNHTR